MRRGAFDEERAKTDTAAVIPGQLIKDMPSRES